MFLILALTAAVQADTSGGPIADPQWEGVPAAMARELNSSYPASARNRGVDGIAVVECKADRRGSLVDCGVVSETPDGAGFGQAALRVARSFHMKPLSLSGTPVEGRSVRLPVRYRMPWSAQEAAGERPAYTITASPDWLRKPTADDLARVYPPAAAEKKLNGAGTIHCKVQPNGGLSDCSIEHEEPAGLGFGDATLKLAPLFRIDMSGAPGRATSGHEISIPIHFFILQD